MLPFLYIGFLKIPMYGVCILCGAALGIFLFCHWCERWDIGKEEAFNSSLFAAIGAILGGKLLYIIVSLPRIIEKWSYYSSSFSHFYSLLSAGFVFYGAFLGGVLAIYLCCKKYHLKFIHFIDKIIIVIPLIHGFGRIGCFCAGCCYGIPYDGIFKVMFREDSFCGLHQYLFPVQLLESLILFMIFGIMVYLSKKNRPDGFLIGAYLVMYPVARFFLEYLRYDAIRGSFLFFSTSQWISIILLICGIALLVRTSSKNSNNIQNEKRSKICQKQKKCARK